MWSEFRKINILPIWNSTSQKNLRQKIFNFIFKNMCKWLNTNYQYKNLGLFPLLLTFKMQAQSVTKVHLSIGLTAPSLGDTTEKDAERV